LVCQVANEKVGYPVMIKVLKKEDKKERDVLQNYLFLSIQKLYFYFKKKNKKASAGGGGKGMRIARNDKEV